MEERYGRLVVVRKIKNLYFCACDCGRRRSVAKKELRRKDKRAIKSCGCLQIEAVIRIGHKNTTHGHNNTPTFRSWTSMKSRCKNPNTLEYKNYGGRGITVCDEWINDFSQFLNDMGERPENMTLDRIDVNKGYYKENCRWASIKTQNNNRRNTRYHEHNNELKTLPELSEKFNIDLKLLQRRIRNGRELEKALKSPPGTKKNS